MRMPRDSIGLRPIGMRVSYAIRKVMMGVRESDSPNVVAQEKHYQKGVQPFYATCHAHRCVLISAQKYRKI